MVLAVALLLGRAALITDTEELLGETPTWTALVVFLAVGAVVMRTDFIEFAKEEARKDGVNFEPASTRWLWLLLALLLSAAVAWNGMTAPQYLPSAAVTGPVTTQKLWQPVLMMEELYLRAAKVTGAPEDLENAVGRDLDASLVRRTDTHTNWVVPRRSARKEIVAM